MTLELEQIDLTGPSEDNLLEAWTKVNAALLAIEEAFAGLGSAAASFDYAKAALTGGAADALDGIDGADLAGSETAMVIAGENPARVYFYVLDADNAGAESAPYVIAPDTNAGNKRWVLAARVPRRWSSGSNPTVNNDQTQGVTAGDEWQTGSRIWKCLSEATGAAAWIEWLQLGTGSGNAAAGNHGHADLATTTALGAVASELSSHKGAASPHSGAATTTELGNHTGASAPHSGHESTANKGQASGYPSLDTNSKVVQEPASKAQASGIASLNSSSLVVEDPANATATPTAGKIAKGDAGGKLDGWITDSTTSVPGKVQLGTGSGNAAQGNHTHAGYVAIADVEAAKIFAMMIAG